jgi:ribosomal protein S12 methylthiotransferase accessory factor
VTAKAYIAGTHRSVPPEATLRVAMPLATSLGVTRCADVTGLDTLGIPVYCSIRPSGLLLQVANGKGSTHIEAQTSALMEAIEHACVETPPERPTWAAVADLRRRGVPFADPPCLQSFNRDVFYSEDRILPWLEGQALPAGTPVLIPAPFVHPMEPNLYRWSTNGLASGNDVLEATLHGLYEVCERQSLSMLTDGDKIELGGCQVVVVSSIVDPVLTPLVACIERAACRLILLRVDLEWKLHTFLALTLDPTPYRGPSIVNLGAGAHLSPTVAAARAITEAAQSRLTFIHGSREDLPGEAYRGRHSDLYERLAGIVPRTAWSEIPDASSADLDTDHDIVMQELDTFGFSDIYRVELPPPGAGVSVVKVAIVGSEMSFLP